jgi:hypothetical protein
VRAIHCRECDVCVATFDHHCSLLRTCVGERNRARFLLLVCAQAAWQSLAIGALTSGLVFRRGVSEWLGANALAMATLVALWLVQLPLAFASLLALWLAATNTTAYETRRGAARVWYLGGRMADARDCDLPFSRGLYANAALFCALEEWPCARAASRAAWRPHEWVPVGTDRDAAVWESAWENAAWSCC